MFKVNDKKTPIPQKIPVRKDDRNIPCKPTRDSGFGKFDRNPQQKPPKPEPKPVKK